MPKSIQNILCSIDLSDYSQPVIDCGAKMARHSGARLLIFYTIASDDNRLYGPDVLDRTGKLERLAAEAHAKLTEQGIAARVVSMPSWELFEKQADSYRDKVLPPSVKARVGIEAGCSMGWQRWLGDQGSMIALDRFGASAPQKIVYERFGFTTDNIVLRALSVIDKSKR